MISIRPATAADQPAIIRLVREAQLNRMDLKWPQFLVAVDDATGRIVGIGQIKRHRDGSYEMASIATVPAYQRRGVAHRLIEQLLLTHPGVLYLTCIDYMEGLYQQFGFRAVETNEMTPYFRRLYKLAKPFLLLGGGSRKLLVMKREPVPSPQNSPKDKTAT